MKKLEELRERLAVLNGQAQAISRRIDEEKRDLTPDEQHELDQILTNFERTKADVDRLAKLGEQTDVLTAPVGRKTEPDAPRQVQDLGEGHVQMEPRQQLGHRPASRDDRVPATYASHGVPKNWNFNSLGEFAVSVRRACLNQGQWDPRLIVSERLAAATTYGSEGTGSDGGFAVPPDFRTAIMEAVAGEESLLARCDQVTISGNSFTAPFDATTPWQSSGGIQAYWGGEGVAKTQSKPALEERNCKLNKVFALVPMTDELLEDAGAMDAYLRKKMPEKIAWKVNEAIVSGNGVGKPLGILNSPALVAVAKESGQQADTIVGNNILKMYSRMYAPSRSKAVWVINQDIEPQLLKLSVPGTDNTGNAVTGWGGLVYMPANGLSDSPFATLFGRPVIPSQAAETLGDLGDVMFADFSQYLALLKGGGANPKTEISMHLWFDQDLTAFRTVLRVGGMPWWAAPVAARDGSATYSPFVALAERA